jgi:hypothetical protein
VKNYILAILMLHCCIATADEVTEQSKAANVNIPSHWGTVRKVDGILEKREWGDVSPYIGALTLAFGKKDDLFVYVMNDDEWLYIAIKFNAQKFVTSETLFITLDEEFSGAYYEGQDIVGLGVRRNGDQTYYDEARTMKPPCVQKAFQSHKVHCAFEDTRMDGTTDGIGAYQFQNQTAVYEFRKPLASSDVEFDAQLALGQLLGLQVHLNAVNANYSEVFVPGPTHMDFFTVAIAERPGQKTPTPGR